MVDFTFLRDLRGRKKLLLILVGIIIFLVTLILGRLFFEYLASGSSRANRDDALTRSISDLIVPPTIENEVLPKTQSGISPLTGGVIKGKVAVKLVGVIIENLPASRPQMRGLDEAGIVIEALAEGGITRFLAVFDTSEAKKVGPVRSARPYFVEWAAELGGALVHAGGSTEALTKLAASNLADFDEDGEMVYRDFQFLAPHNLFVNLADVRVNLPENNSLESRFDFSGKIPATATDVRQFSLDFSLPSYLVEYNYDATDGKYARKIGGVPHKAGGNAIRPANIIIQFTEYFPIDDAGRLELKTTGENTAWYFSEGKFWRGVWRKIDGRTKFFDNFGRPVSLNPGQTFIEILDASARVKIPKAI
ncbi:MAG: DUF3048 domain-containing protein [Patescibacteria group bacterium]